MRTDTDMMADLRHLISKAESAVHAGMWSEVKKYAEQIILLEDAIIIHRIQNSSQRQVFEVQVRGNK